MATEAVLQTYPDSSVKDYWTLLKPRVMSLVIFTGLIGILLAPGTLHPFLVFISLLCIAVGAGGAGALNMWYERSLDGLMRRTAGRPLPMARVLPDDALALGMISCISSVILMGLAINMIAAFLLAFTIFFYVCVYTMWLKPTTPQNIVIGGASGALPPVIGWFAVSPTFSWEPLLLFAIIFIWTPSHFWALALLQVEDYRRAKIPMLPVLVGSLKTRRQILAYSIFLVMVAACPFIMGFFDYFYLGMSTVLGMAYLYFAWRTYQSEKYALSLFKYSILYLFLLFLSMLIDYYWV